MDTFTPSLDWGNELAASALWVLKAWAISAVGIVGTAALLARYTTWGRQFWRVSGDYFKGRQSIPVWALLGVLLALVMVDVRLVVLFTYQSNDQFSAMQAAFEGEGAAKDAAIHGFWVSLVILAGLIIAPIIMSVFVAAFRLYEREVRTGGLLGASPAASAASAASPSSSRAPAQSAT